MKTKIINEIKKGKYYYYELENTIFFVEGGGQMKDEGTINGVAVLSCFENEGHIYHQTEKKIFDVEVELMIDEKHRYISCQGHTAQHLLSAAFYELFNYKTISHHYNLEGSYIDLETKEITEQQLKEAEDWVNNHIRLAHPIHILYPTIEEFNLMPIHHDLKVDHDIRIVHIEDVEYNPCKGMHVSNTSEVQCVYVLRYEMIKGNVRIHYMFGEVARLYFHLYYQELKNISVEVSKPMTESSLGVQKLKETNHQLSMELSDLSKQYIDLYVKQFENKEVAIHPCDLNQDLLNQLCLKLSTMNNLTCYLFTSKQIIVVSSKDEARVLFDDLKQHFSIRGGENPKICRGTSDLLDEIKKYLEKKYNL